tara:strand:+ start:182 stop:412 length:231 start_codon:yes stop_codon:yes gene_type:complete
MSVVLNYIEGYARFKPKMKLNFYEISFASLKESKFLVFFSHKEEYIAKEEYEDLWHRAEEVAKMLWSEIELVKSMC